VLDHYPSGKPCHRIKKESGVRVLVLFLKRGYRLKGVPQRKNQGYILSVPASGNTVKICPEERKN
jgi:hypothetical protein